MTENETVMVRIKKGFGSHTLMEDFVDEVGEKGQRGVIHRNGDKDAFELPVSAYNEFPIKYTLCDPETGEIIAPVVQTVQSVTMADKIKAATKKTAKNVPVRS